jgi:hypothetical protein
MANRTKLKSYYFAGEKFEISSGNVFLDLGFTKKEATKLLKESDRRIDRQIARAKGEK